MTKIVVNTIRSQPGVTSVTFHDTVTANGKKQWLDRFGIIKANSENIDENVIIPSGTNGYQSAQFELVQDILSQFKVTGG